MTTNNPTPQPAGESGAPELKSCPLCPDGGKPYFTRAVNGTQMAYVGCSQCGITLKCAVLGYGEDAPLSKDIVAVWNTRATQPATAPSELRRVFCEYHLHSPRHIYAFDECMVSPCDSARRLLATPTAVAERARRAAEKVADMFGAIPLPDSRAEIVSRVMDIIAAEFGGSGNRST